MAITVRYEKEGKLEEWLLDIVEVGKQHTGVNLAVEFAKILDDYGCNSRSSPLPATMPATTMP